jgi:hypothetical protein
MSVSGSTHFENIAQSVCLRHGRGQSLRDKFTNPAETSPIGSCPEEDTEGYQDSKEELQACAPRCHTETNPRNTGMFRRDAPSIARDR